MSCRPAEDEARAGYDRGPVQVRQIPHPGGVAAGAKQGAFPCTRHAANECIECLWVHLAAHLTCWAR